MYLPPEYQLMLIRQQQRDLYLRAERARLTRGIKSVRLRLRFMAAWRAFRAPGPTRGRAATQR